MVVVPGDVVVIDEFTKVHYRHPIQPPWQIMSIAFILESSPSVELVSIPLPHFHSFPHILTAEWYEDPPYCAFIPPAWDYAADGYSQLFGCWSRFAVIAVSPLQLYSSSAEYGCDSENAQWILLLFRFPKASPQGAVRYCIL